MRNAFILLSLLVSIKTLSQCADPWLIEAKSIDPDNYYGVTVANGMIGLVLPLNQ